MADIIDLRAFRAGVFRLRAALHRQAEAEYDAAAVDAFTKATDQGQLADLCDRVADGLDAERALEAASA